MKPTVIEETDVSVIGRKRMRVKLIVPHADTLLRERIEALCKKEAERRFRRFRGPIAVALFLYRDGDDTEQAFTVASYFASKDGKNWVGADVPQNRWSKLVVR